jgi:hypothetical protein
VTSAVPAATNTPAAAPAATPDAAAKPVEPAAAEPAPAPPPVEVKAPEPAPAVPPPAAEKTIEPAPVPTVEASKVEEKSKANPDLAATVVDLPIFSAPAAAPVDAAPADGAARESKVDVAHPASNGSAVEAALVANTLLFERDQDPSATNPLTYRERVYSVAAGTTVAQAEAVARHSLTSLKRSLATRPRGRYVTVAVFDHVFASRPAESPLVVLRWKDWRSDVPELQVRPALPPAVVAEPPAPTNGAVDEAPAVETPAASSAAATPAEVSAPEAPPAVVVADPPVAAAIAETAPSAAAEPAVVVPEAVPAPVVAAAAEPAAVVAQAVAAVEPVVAAEPAAVASAPAPPVAPPPDATAEPAAETAPAGDAASAPVESPSMVVADAVAEAPAPAAPAGERESTGPEISAGPDAAVQASDAAESGEHETATSETAAESTGESGGRRKKRRGRRESQPSLPTAPAAPVAAAAPVVDPDRKRYTGGRRGPDLLSDLFDSVMELSFQHTGQEVCAFVTNVLTQNLRCDAVLVLGYDINRDEFVVHGEAATRSKRGVNLAAAKGDDRADPACEGGPALFVPALHHERLFALVQVARLPGSPAFEADELDAATYIAGQLAEALAHHALRPTAAELSEKKEAPVRESRRPR